MRYVGVLVKSTLHIAVDGSKSHTLQQAHVFRHVTIRASRRENGLHHALEFFWRQLADHVPMRPEQQQTFSFIVGAHCVHLLN